MKKSVKGGATSSNVAKSESKNAASTGRKVTNNTTTKGAKGRNNAADQLQHAVKLESEDVSVSALAAKIRAFFDVPEWSGAGSLRAALLPLVEAGTMTCEQYDKAVAAAARAAGVPVPVCSVARVLAVIRRENLVNEFKNVVGYSFAGVLDYFRNSPASSFVAVPLLNGSCVLSNSDVKDFVRVSSLASDATASQIVRGLLSFRHLAKFFKLRDAARVDDLNTYRVAIGNVVRCGLRCGYSVEDIAKAVADAAPTIRNTDASERKRLRRNLESVQKSLAAVEGEILALCPSLCSDGVWVSSLPSQGVPAKVRRSLWGKRSRFLSSSETLRALLNM